MNTDLGYTKPLFILAFDHRSSFVKSLFGIEARSPTDEEVAKIKEAKQIIYEGFEHAVKDTIPKEHAALLVDEQFGDAILFDAIAKGYIVALTTEKSGQEEFDFEYGQDFMQHIEVYRPTFAKALVRYNPKADKEANMHQLNKLKTLSDFCHENGYKFLIELLVPSQNDAVHSKLVKESIVQFQNFGVEPDVWKIEGMEESGYQAVADQARSDGRYNVGVVILGRGEEQEQVEMWLRVGAPVEGIIGFAIGRTIFWQPLASNLRGETDRTQTIDAIAKNYIHFYTVFKEAKEAV